MLDDIAYNFLKLLSPFGVLDQEKLHHLAASLKKVTLPAGEVIVRQGEKGEACYLVRSGKVEVVASDPKGHEHSLATLSEGSLFGEAALLTDLPRNATVKALEACQLYVLSKSDFLAAVQSSRLLGAAVMELLRLRDRPKQVEGVVAEQRKTADGDPITILKNPATHSYFHLSEEGRFIWERLDGENNLRDLALAYFEKYRSFAPHAIAETIGKLIEAGFAKSRTLERIVSGKRGRKWWHSLFHWRVTFRRVDSVLKRLYQKGMRGFYRWPVQILLGVIVIWGGVVFSLPKFSPSLWQGQFTQPLFWLKLLPAAAFSIVVHEMAHALTVIHFGRSIYGVGVGWHWVSPVFFVDTSDMWMEERGRRILVSLAGPYANLILGSLFSLLTLAFKVSPVAASYCSLVALGNYGVALLNLIPLFSDDGDEALKDFRSRM